MKKVIGTISLCALCAIICSSLLAQGTKTGWPTAHQLKKFGLTNLKQPAGVKSSYTYKEESETSSNLEVTMTGANAKTLQELKQQIEKATGGKIFQEPGNPNKYSGGCRVGRCSIDLELKGNLLKMSFLADTYIQGQE